MSEAEKLTFLLTDRMVRQAPEDPMVRSFWCMCCLAIVGLRILGGLSYG